MRAKKWIPWNWFKKEESGAGGTVPVKQGSNQENGYGVGDSIAQFHREIDRLFDHTFRGMGLAPFDFSRPLEPRMSRALLKPTLDLGATDKEYILTVEIPGVDEKDVKLELANDTLTIQGEKKQENEEKGKGFYRMERSYGSFQRVLSLPEDADQDSIKATFKKGVLTVTMPRKALPKTDVQKITIN